MRVLATKRKIPKSLKAIPRLSHGRRKRLNPMRKVLTRVIKVIIIGKQSRASGHRRMHKPTTTTLITIPRPPKKRGNSIPIASHNTPTPKAHIFRRMPYHIPYPVGNRENITPLTTMDAIGDVTKPTTAPTTEPTTALMSPMESANAGTATIVPIMAEGVRWPRKTLKTAPKLMSPSGPTSCGAGAEPAWLPSAGV